MTQKTLVFFLNIIVLTSNLVCPESHSFLSKIGKKNIPQESGGPWDLSDCGRRAISNEIETNTTESNILNWPWVVSIYFTDPSTNVTKYFGTASIITEKYLITVAQVFRSRNISEDRPSNYFAAVGGGLEKGFIYSIQSIDIHFINGDQQSSLGGIAIVQLVNAMTLSDYVRPICLPKTEDKDKDHRNQSLVAVGWSRSSNDYSETEVLYETNIPILPEEFCQQYIKGSYPSKNLICGRISKETTSKIINGTPLMTTIYDQMNDDYKFTLIGLTDRGIGREQIKGNARVPIYFLKVASYLDLINKVTQNSKDSGL